jgi:spermidine synthase
MFNSKVFVELNHCLSTVFSKNKVQTMLFHVPTYPTGLWSFQVATKGDFVVTNNLDEEQIDSFTAENDLNYYNIHVHKAAFALPNFVQKLLNQH